MGRSKKYKDPNYDPLRDGKRMLVMKTLEEFRASDEQGSRYFALFSPRTFRFIFAFSWHGTFGAGS
jgi:hypothetical protein